MKPRFSPAAFTLIEMLTVMAVIAILASILLSLNGLVQRKAALTRAHGEIVAMSAACESYKSDFGGYLDLFLDILSIWLCQLPSCSRCQP